MKHLPITENVSLVFLLAGPFVMAHFAELSPVSFGVVLALGSLLVGAWGVSRVFLGTFGSQRIQHRLKLVFSVWMAVLVASSLYGALIVESREGFLFACWLPVHLVYLLMAYASPKFFS